MLGGGGGSWQTAISKILIYKTKIKFRTNIGRDWAAFSAIVLGNGVSVMHTVAPAWWESTVHLARELRREL